MVAILTLSCLFHKKNKSRDIWHMPIQAIERKLQRQSVNSNKKTKKNWVAAMDYIIYLKLGTHLSLHWLAPHRIASVCQCQHKRSETYALNMLMHCVDPIRLLLVHQSKHYFLRAQCGQLFYHFSCLSGQQMYFTLL